MARKKKASSAPQGFSETAWNKLSTTWRDAAQSKSTEDLEQDIIKSVRTMSNTTHDMKNDATLKDLMEKVKDLKGGYKEVIDEAKAQIDFCIFLMNTRGTKVDSSDSDEDSAA